MLSWLDAEAPGPCVCLSFGVHGDERAPIDAGRMLAASLSETGIDAGSLLLVLGNPAAAAADRRYCEADLNRCFTAEILESTAETPEVARAQLLAEAVSEVEVLVDFHCTVEPGERFVMHHPDDARHRQVAALLDAPVVLSDPALHFGGCSLDELLSTRGRVGICYETGWIGDPDNTPQRVLAEMRNVLVGLGVLAGTPKRRAGQRALVLTEVLRCPPGGFAWADGVGANLQSLPAGAVLGAGGDGPVTLDAPATLVFPKKRPELLRPGQPLVYLAAEG